MKELREKAVMSQPEVASAVGVTPATVSRWESGKRMPRPAHIRRLAELFKVDPQVVRQVAEDHYTGGEERAS